MKKKNDAWNLYTQEFAQGLGWCGDWMLKKSWEESVKDWLEFYRVLNSDISLEEKGKRGGPILSRMLTEVPAATPRWW